MKKIDVIKNFWIYFIEGTPIKKKGLDQFF